jgi:glycosidase
MNKKAGICHGRNRAARVAIVAIATMIATNKPAGAEDVSAPAILQMFEARWDTIEDRMADIFEVGYGQMWLPPPQRADSGNQSVGYDVFDRFDLGGPRNETLYGTETSLKTLVRGAHSAGIDVYTDYIVNHNGFANLGTVDDQGTTDPEDDVTFADSGGYPGFVLQLPPGCADSAHCTDGDFHGAFEGGDWNGRISTLIDIAQEANHQFIRHPTTPGNPQNIPAGTVGIFGRPPANVPNPNNARFYPDQNDPGLTITDPALGGMTVTRYNYDTETPLDGDPVAENATGLLMRNAQWMIQEIGVDGFRVDAAKHVPQWVLNYIDHAVFRASSRMNHDGTIKPVFMFSEVLDDNKAHIQSYIRKDLPNSRGISPSNFTVGGNRDALDFPLSFALRFNLTDNGTFNNWYNIRHSSQDNHDNGLIDGSSGVLFVDNHDDMDGDFIPGDGAPFLDKVAHAYTLMRPGNAIVYYNAEEFGSAEFRNFPTEGTDDALGGPIAGDAVAKLVGIRNSHGRGNYRERFIDPGSFSNIFVYERDNSAIVGLNSRADTGYDEREFVDTGFAPGTVLVELTGNSLDPRVDPNNNDIPETIRVDGNGQIKIRIPRNEYLDLGDPETSEDDEYKIHGLGYVVYGVAGPQGSLSLSNVSSTIQGGTPMASTHGTTRLADIDVITGNTFDVRLDTMPVSLADPDNPGMFVRDFDADGDAARIRIDGGMDLNSLPGIDVTNPADVSYGFELFTDTNTPGFGNDGTGVYEQQIDATQLAEGRHHITVRAFRHRDSGPAVFTDFKRTIYVDRLPPEAAIASFDPFATAPGNPNNRDLIVTSVDGTADNMHMYLDLPASMTDAQVFALTQMGQNDSDNYDRDSFIFGFNNVSTGNHVATIVTFEQTGNYSIQRFAGLFTDTNIGAGFGDLNNNGTFTTTDVLGIGNNSAEDILYSQNTKFRAAFDVNGDGLGDNRDLFALGNELVAGGASQAVLTSYEQLLLKRGDLNGSGTTNVSDLEALYANLGPATWLFDLNVDGVVDEADAETLITQLARTVPGDFNLDGVVDAADYTVWRNLLGQAGSALIADGDFNGQVDGNDYLVWKAAYGFEREPFGAPGAGGLAIVPEPSAITLVVLLLAVVSVMVNRTTFGMQTQT